MTKNTQASEQTEARGSSFYLQAKGTSGIMRPRDMREFSQWIIDQGGRVIEVPDGERCMVVFEEGFPGSQMGDLPIEFANNLGVQLEPNNFVILRQVIMTPAHVDHFTILGFVRDEAIHFLPHSGAAEISGMIDSLAETAELSDEELEEAEAETEMPLEMMIKTNPIAAMRQLSDHEGGQA